MNEQVKPIEPGQHLWYVPKHRRNGEGRFVIVEKVGRVWATVNIRGKVRLDTMALIEGDFTCGQCYLDKDAYEHELERHRAWLAIKNGMSYQPPSSVSFEDITRAAELIGINIARP